LHEGLEDRGGKAASGRRNLLERPNRSCDGGGHASARQSANCASLQLDRHLLHEIVPAAAMIGYLRDPSGPFPEAETKDAETAARTLGVQLAFLNASTPSQIEILVERRIGALTIGAGAFLSVQ
jgi:hypothetical protein